jgi:uncharacterized OB-fold protein
VSEAKPVRSIVTPTRLEYEFTASGAHAEFLENIARGRLVGKRCPDCAKVYVPARGNCPRCGIATAESVEVSDRGTVTTFCIVRVPSENIDLELPYCAANVLLDGSDMPFIALLQECRVEEVRIGMRVQAVWKPAAEWGPTFENIRYFRPTGEPDVPVEKLGSWV